MLTFIQTLQQRYIHLLPTRDDQTRAQWTQILASLQLAQVSLIKVNQKQQIPLQIAVIGPTQAGKSTVLNLLTNSEAAGVSALAGYTVHAQAFYSGNASDNRWLQHIFSRLHSNRTIRAQRRSPAQLLGQSIALDLHAKFVAVLALGFTRL